jgi:flagellar protein FlaG
MAQDITGLSAVPTAPQSAGYGVFQAPARASARAEPGVGQTAVRTATPANDLLPENPATASDMDRREQVERAVEEISQRVEARQANLQFRIDDDAGRLVVSLVDARDGKVLRQFPSEVALRIADAIDDFLEDLRLVEEVA